MPIDKRGRYTEKGRRGERGPAGIGFQLTQNGDYSLGNKKLLHLSIEENEEKKEELTEAVSVHLLNTKLEKNQNILKKYVEDKLVEIKMAQDNLHNELTLLNNTISEISSINTKIQDLNILGVHTRSIYNILSVIIFAILQHNQPKEKETLNIISGILPLISQTSPAVYIVKGNYLHSIDSKEWSNIGPAQALTNEEPSTFNNDQKDLKPIATEYSK